jgi:peptidoglycan hydrolase CwlO-like protein
MNVIGKIFVFAVFVMSLMLMTFAGVIYMSHVNWKDEVYRDPKDCLPGQQPGYDYQLKQATAEREKLTGEITELQRKVAESEQSRDQVIARLQSAIVKKDEELMALRGEKDKREELQQKTIAELEEARKQLEQVTKDVATLTAQVKDQQQKVDSQVDRSARLSASLAEVQAQLEIAEERKSQLEKQVANARLLLQQAGLSIDSPPKDRVPTLTGDVIAVATGSIQVSLGSDDGLQVGHTLEVYRGAEYIGRAVVKSVMPDHAVAELVKDYSRGIVQRGDKVTTRLKA